MGNCPCFESKQTEEQLPNDDHIEVSVGKKTYQKKIVVVGESSVGKTTMIT